MILSDDTLHDIIGANAPQVRKYGHESLRFKWRRLDVNWHIRIWRMINALSAHLIGEKGGNYAKQTWYDSMVADNMGGDTRNRE